MIGSLRNGKGSATRSLSKLAGTKEDLTVYQKGNQDVDGAMEVFMSADQIVLVTSVGVASTVRVVLEDEDLASDSFFLETLLGPFHQTFENPLPGLVVSDHILEVITLRCGELGVRANIEVETGTVLQKHIGRASPGHDSTE